MLIDLQVFFVTIASAEIGPSNGTNSMMGPPEVACTQDGVAFTMETEKPFHGQLYVKDEYHNPKCRINFKGVHKPGATFHLTFNECGMRRQRVVRGLISPLIMIVAVHFFLAESTRHDVLNDHDGPVSRRLRHPRRPSVSDTLFLQ